MSALERVSLSCLVFAVLMACSHANAADDRYGKISGAVVIAELPADRPPLVEQHAPIRDADCCSGREIPDESLLVHKRSGGVSNVFVWLRNVDKVHSSLTTDPHGVVLSANGCQFTPHVLTLRTVDWVAFKSDDECVHYPGDVPLRSPRQSLLPSDQPIVFRYHHAESKPLPVFCHYHAWMKAWILVIDHPYATTTNSRGRFRLGKVPYGDYELLVWHESVGFLQDPQSITVDRRRVVLKKFELPPARNPVNVSAEPCDRRECLPLPVPRSRRGAGSS